MKNGSFYKIALVIIIIAIAGVFISTYYDKREYTNKVYFEEEIRAQFYKDTPGYEELQSDKERIEKLIKEANEIADRLNRLSYEFEKSQENK